MLVIFQCLPWSGLTLLERRLWCLLSKKSTMPEYERILRCWSLKAFAKMDLNFSRLDYDSFSLINDCVTEETFSWILEQRNFCSSDFNGCVVHFEAEIFSDVVKIDKRLESYFGIRRNYRATIIGIFQKWLRKCIEI